MSNGFLPTWYDAAQCGQLRFPDLARAAAEGAAYAKANKPGPGRRSGGIILTVIDMQLDFIHLLGTLCVPGAIPDVDRLNQFGYRNVDVIDQVTASLDTHYLYQPFHPFTWAAGAKPTARQDGTAYQTGDHPDPFTIITAADIQDGVWLPVRLPAKMIEMVGKLEKEGKKQLCIWPLHCMLGSPGHALDPSVAEFAVFHTRARQLQTTLTEKGMSQSSEHYGILQAEVQFSDDPRTQLNTQILDKWAQADRVYFAGQAKTHCVLETLNQVVSLLSQRGQQAMFDRLYVLEDCMSPVPDVEDAGGNVIAPFNQWADERFAELKNMGVKFVKSTDPVVV